MTFSIKNEHQINYTLSLFNLKFVIFIIFGDHTVTQYDNYIAKWIEDNPMKFLWTITTL